MKMLKQILAIACAALLLAAPLQAATVGELLAKADALRVEGKVKEAEQVYKQAIAEDGNHIPARMHLGGLYLTTQRNTEAVEVFQEVIGRQPSNDKAFIALAMAYLHGNRTPLAVAALREALRIQPGNGDEINPIIARLEARLKAMSEQHSMGNNPHAKSPHAAKGSSTH